MSIEYGRPQRSRGITTFEKAGYSGDSGSSSETLSGDGSSDPSSDIGASPSQARVSADPINLPGSVPDDVTHIDNAFDNIPEESDEFANMRDQYDNLKNSIEGQITKISDADFSFDTDGLVGEINARFGRIKNRITDSALMSVEKAGLDLDTYFGSEKGDQRSGVRVRMAANVKNSMMQSAFRAIGEIYDKNTSMVVSAELEGAKLNLQGAVAKAKAIADFTGLATQAYLGVLSETNKNYATRLSASVKWAQVQAQARGQDIQFASAMKDLEVRQRGQTLAADVTQRGQDINAETTRRGQDLQERLNFERLTSEGDRIKLEYQKANLQASMMVWKNQGRETQRRWTPAMGQSAKTAHDFGSYKTIRSSGVGGSYESTYFQYDDQAGQNRYYTPTGAYM